MTAPRPDRPLLMLVDDEPDILVALTDLFEGSYQVVAFTRPVEALVALQAGADVAVVVSDQRMPEMSGDAFLAAARKLSDAGAILLTGYADLSAVTAALNSGGIVGYAPKPWEPDALRAMVGSAAEQHYLRRALRQEQALLRGLMEHLPLAVSFKDAEGRFVQVNGLKAAALGVAAQAAIGRTESELGGARPSPAELSALAQRRPVQAVMDDGAESGPSWVQTDYVPILDPTGEVEHLVVLERDITEQKIAELQMRQTDKLRALGTLAGGVAHDFNNLLTAILGSLELAGRRLHDERALRRYLDNAGLAAQKGAALTQRLLGFTRQSEGRPTLVDTVAVVGGMRDLVARTLAGSVQVEWAIAADLWPVAIEADQLELAVLNLAINARDAMPEGGVISVSAHNTVSDGADLPGDLSAGEYVVVTVADTGSGMSPEVLARVLEPFFTTKPIGKGTGLGLPMVYGFAQRSGGALDIKSELGRGAQVSIYLPRAAVALQDPEDAAPAGPPPDTRKGRILVVDDEPGVRSVTAACLRDLGHEVLEAKDARTGLRMIQEEAEPVDLALVDFAMPGMNGVEFVEAAREVSPSLPVILLTGYMAPEAVPADVALMHKPFTPKGLQQAIAQALKDEAPAEG